MNGVSRNRGARQMVLVVILAAVAVVFLDSLSYGVSRETVFDSVFHSIIIGSSVCIGVLLVIPKIEMNPLWIRILIVSATILFAALTGIFITRLFLGVYYGKEFGGFYLPNQRTFIFSMVISYIFGFSAYFYVSSQHRLEKAQEELKQKELNEANVRSLAAEAQLAALESKIHPHFLFNTLNSIAALIRENPDRAEKMVEKLSALLRYSLDENANGTVSLLSEIEITRKYLEIEKERFAERLAFSIEGFESVEKIKIPSLSIQTLVENSIKHVASKSSKKTEIRVFAKSEGKSFIIEVSDSGSGFSKNDLSEGHGLDNLRKRLKNIFEENADLEIIENDNCGKVRLKIPV
ncbi:MAG: histidine kinase, partial [Acidobacteria bacterium]|nr:histidine kinase [Acidobacteriota bacterium]